ncbi:MAG: hypothetical protein WDA00_01120 [Eubacteriales bacterium]
MKQMRFYGRLLLLLLVVLLTASCQKGKPTDITTVPHVTTTTSGTTTTPPVVTTTTPPHTTTTPPSGVTTTTTLTTTTTGTVQPFLEEVALVTELLQASRPTLVEALTSSCYTAYAKTLASQVTLQLMETESGTFARVAYAYERANPVGSDTPFTTETGVTIVREEALPDTGELTFLGMQLQAEYFSQFEIEYAEDQSVRSVYMAIHNEFVSDFLGFSFAGTALVVQLEAEEGRLVSLGLVANTSFGTMGTTCTYGYAPQTFPLED